MTFLISHRSALASATHTGDPNYDAFYDLNSDGFIDITDLSLIGGQFGKACPSTFTYNGDGLRTARGGSWLNSKYVWDTAAGLPVILKETDSHQAASSLGADNTYVYGLGLISVTDRTGAQTYFTADGLGSTTDLTNASATKTDGYTYDVFGTPTHTTGGSANNFQFTGQQRDANSGLDYLRARYYDPSTGRFLSRDPLMIGNRYSYVGNNPLNYIDPYGLFGIPGTGIDIDIPDPSDIIAPVVDFASTYSTVVSIIDLVPASPWYIEVTNGVLTQLNIMTSDCSTATKIRLTLMNGLNIGAGIGGTALLPPAAAVAGPVGVGAVVTVTFAVEAGLATANQVIIDGCSKTVYANSGHKSNPKE